MKYLITTLCIALLAGNVQAKTPTTSRDPANPPSAQDQTVVQQALSGLKVGMKRKEALAILEKFLGTHFGGRVGGPLKNYGERYSFPHGVQIGLIFDCTQGPPALVSWPGRQPDLSDLTYIVGETSVTITHCRRTGGNLLIPATINGKPVVNIGRAAFSHTSLKTVNIPNSVTNIGERAFSSSYNLKSVNIPNSVVSIGASAFSDTRYLTNIVIGNSITNIGQAAFAVCTRLMKITIPNSVTSIGERAFYRCSSLTNVTIGNSVARIGGQAFRNCGSLMSVSIPNSVTSIGPSTFSRCRSLTSVSIPNSVGSIGGYAFYGCDRMTNITIGNSVTNIGDKAFYRCSGLRIVRFLGNAPTIGASAFPVYNKGFVFKISPGATGFEWAKGRTIVE